VLHDGLTGTARYEFVMQIRRKSFWIAALVLGGLSVAVVASNIVPHSKDLSANVTHNNIVVNLITSIGYLLGLGTGLLLADRSSRDRTVRVREVLRATPVSSLARLLGRYLGNVAAVLVPVGLCWAIAIAVVVTRWGDLGILPLALAGLALLVVPPVLFVAAWSIACTTVMWPPLYQFLFVGYWLWISLQPGGPIPTLDGTVLSPLERLTQTGVFHFAPFTRADISYYPTASLWLGLANIAALVGTGLLALLAAWAIERRRAAME
jgi:ABC-2 type transport system permease protein